MVKDAEAHAGEDKARREQVEARNRLDSMVYDVEKNKKEWEDKLDAPTRTSLDEALERARKALKQDDVGEVRSASEALQQAYSAAGALIYAAQQQGEAGAADAGFSGGATAGAGFDGDATARAGGQAADDVVEADYEIVDDNK